MERPNQPPKPECCAAEGIGEVDLWFYRTERRTRSVHREKCEPQAGPASCLSNSDEKGKKNGDGDRVEWPEHKTEDTAKGEVAGGLPGSKSVTRTEGDTWNRGGPEFSRRTNCEGQAGTGGQRQEA